MNQFNSEILYRQEKVRQFFQRRAKRHGTGQKVTPEIQDQLKRAFLRATLALERVGWIDPSQTTFDSSRSPSGLDKP